MKGGSARLAIVLPVVVTSPSPSGAAWARLIVGTIRIARQGGRVARIVVS